MRHWEDNRDTVSETSTNSRSGSWWINVLLTLTVVVCLAFVAGSFLSPNFIHIDSAEGRARIDAFVALKILNKMQKGYAANHASGFTCQLEQLKTAGPPEYQGYNPNAQLSYQFAISQCRPDASGRITQYQITATPNKHGYWAFCSDQSGFIWRDEDGSVSKCLLERRNGLNPEEEKEEEK